MSIGTQHDAPEAAQVAPPKVRMDKSRAFSTVHGDRPPSDRNARVFFFQDGLPVDASGYFMFDHPDMIEPGPEGDKRRKMAERKIKKALAQQAKQPVRAAPLPSDDDEEDGDDAADRVEAADDDAEQELEPINLDAWLRGEQQVEWQEVTQEIARRYKKRISKMEDAVAFLVKEGVCPKGQLKRQFQKFAD